MSTHEVVREQKEEAAATVNKFLLTINYASMFVRSSVASASSNPCSTENQEISDYLKEGDIGFKKPKKKRKHAARKVEESDITPDADINEEMDADLPVVPSRNLDTNFVDDDELQAALARSRKAKMKKVPQLSPEDIAKRGARSYCVCALLSHRDSS